MHTPPQGGKEDSREKFRAEVQEGLHQVLWLQHPSHIVRVGATLPQLFALKQHEGEAIWVREWSFNHEAFVIESQEITNPENYADPLVTVTLQGFDLGTQEPTRQIQEGIHIYTLKWLQIQAPFTPSK
jgi:hypothetical protein